MTKRKGKTRPRYEDYGVSRAQLEHDWEQLKAWGYIGDPDEEAERLIRACHEMHFIHSPRDGWAHVARELRIIEFQLPERKRSGSLSRSQMAKKCSSIADQLWEIGNEMSEMAWQEDYTMAALEAKSGAAGGERFEYVNLPGQIVGLVSPLRKLAFWLDLSSNWHSKKHKAFSARVGRLVLACKLLPVFAEQFDLETALRGGSASLPIGEESPWAQFYQAAASIVLDENSTPDRQGVLLEARWATE